MRTLKMFVKTSRGVINTRLHLPSLNLGLVGIWPKAFIATAIPSKFECSRGYFAYENSQKFWNIYLVKFLNMLKQMIFI